MRIAFRAGCAVIALVCAACSPVRTADDDVVVPQAAGRENYDTVTGSVVVGDPNFLAPGSGRLPNVLVPSELPETIDGGAGLRRVGVVDVVLHETNGRRSVEYRLGGNGPVAYTVRYVDEAIRYATSEPVGVPGTSVLQVDLSGTSADGHETFRPYGGPERIRGAAQQAIASVDFLSDPDGISQSFIGVRAARPDFTVTTTEDPPSVVVAVL